MRKTKIHCSAVFQNTIFRNPNLLIYNLLQKPKDLNSFSFCNRLIYKQLETLSNRK